MGRAHWAIPLTLAACASRPPPRPAPAPTVAIATPAPTPSVAPAPPPPPPPDAEATVDARMPALTPLSPDEASWMPAAVLGAIHDATGVLPLPSAPRRTDDRERWSLITPPRSDPSRVRSVCDALASRAASVACAVDAVDHAGSSRARVVIGWRVTDGARASIGLLHPLRALSRVGRNVCLVSAEPTARTLDLTVHADDPTALTRTLALWTVSPSLHDLIVVGTEPDAGGLRARLSWPLDGDRRAAGTLGDDPWPARCGGASDVGRDVARGTRPRPLQRLATAQGDGAVVAAGRRTWIVITGDQIAGVAVTGISARGVDVRWPGRAAPLRLVFPASSTPGRSPTR